HQRHGPAIVRVGNSDRLGNVDKFSRAVVQPDFFILIARQAAPIKCRPVFRIANDGAVSASYFRKVVPVTPVPVGGNVAVGQEQVERAVVIQVAKLRTKAPSAKLYTKVACQVFILDVTPVVPCLRPPKFFPLEHKPSSENMETENQFSASFRMSPKAAFIPLL